MLYLRSPCHFKFSIAAGTQTHYLRFLGIGSFRKAAVHTTAYRVPVLTPQLYIFSYIAARDVCTPPEWRKLVECPTGHGQPSPPLSQPSHDLTGLTAAS